MNDLTAEDFKAMMTEENTVVIDVRTPEEEFEGNIDGSININLMDPSFIEKIDALDQSKKYLLYCRSGGRSATACQVMDKKGFETYNLLGGIQAWNELD